MSWLRQSAVAVEPEAPLSDADKLAAAEREVAFASGELRAADLALKKYNQENAQIPLFIRNKPLSTVITFRDPVQRFLEHKKEEAQARFNAALRNIADLKAGGIAWKS